MKILYQPTTDVPEDWKSCDSSEWGGLGDFKVHAINIQGDIWVGYDYYGIRNEQDGTVTVAGWCDSSDWTIGNRWARVRKYNFIGPDSRIQFGGAYNKNSQTIIYADSRRLFNLSYKDNPSYITEKYNNFDSRGWYKKDGIWVSDAQHDDLNKVQSIRGWREWTENVPVEFCSNGRLISQRDIGFYQVPEGTLTFYHTTASVPITAYDATYENFISRVTASTNTQTVSNITKGETGWAARTDSKAIIELQWPTTGTYRCQLDISSISTNCEIGLKNLGDGIGHFSRNATQSFEQSQSTFTSTGLHIASVTDPSWSSGNLSDGLYIAIAVNRVTGHAKESVTLQLGESDDFIDGPWPRFESNIIPSTFF